MKRLQILLTVMLLTACQTTEQQAVSYENMYRDYSCSQLKAEMGRISSKMDQKMAKAPANEILDAAVAAFAISRGYSVGGSDDDQELKSLRVQFDTLDRLYIKKDCVKS